MGSVDIILKLNTFYFFNFNFTRYHELVKLIMLNLYSLRNGKYKQASDQNLDEENFEQLINTNVKNKQAVEDRSGQEYLLPDGTPIYKFFKRNPYGG